MNTEHLRGKRLQRCQQGRPSPFVPINVHSYPKLYMCTLPSPCFLCFGVNRFFFLFFSYTMPQHIPWSWWWWTIIIFHDKFVLRPYCFTSFTVHIWFLQNVYTPNNCTVLHNTFFIGNCEHWWAQKGKDDLADISVIFFLYGSRVAGEIWLQFYSTYLINIRKHTNKITQFLFSKMLIGWNL